MKVLASYFSLFTIFYLFLFIYYKSKTFIEVTGILSALIESFLPIPQFLKNRKEKSVKSLSFMMIFLWGLGDTIKFLFYIIRA